LGDFQLSIAEQLDQAVREYESPSRHGVRLALILSDNVAELLIGHWLETTISFHSALDRDQRLRKLSRSNSYPRKLHVLEELGEISAKEQVFLAGVHRIRNGLYHGHDSPQPFYSELFEQSYYLNTRLLERLEPGYRSWYSAVVFSETEQRYLEKAAPSGSLSFDLSLLGKALRERIGEISDGSFAEALKSYSIDRKQDVQEAIRFIGENSPNRTRGQKLIVEAQFLFELEAYLERQGLDRTNYFSPRSNDAQKAYLNFQREFKPRFRAIPFPFWASCIAKISDAKDPLDAFYWFAEIERRIGSLIEAIFHLESEVDAWIQSEIDRWRGK
jgi:hypothetical protein